MKARRMWSHRMNRSSTWVVPGSKGMLDSLKILRSARLRDYRGKNSRENSFVRRLECYLARVNCKTSPYQKFEVSRSWQSDFRYCR